MPKSQRSVDRPTRAATGRTPRHIGGTTMAKGATAVARKDEETTNLPAPTGMMDQFDQDAGKGRENVRAQDLATPFWVILQKMSPECDKTTGNYLPGAEQGMIMNTVTKELIPADVGLEVLPAHFEKFVIEWTPRESGGGLVAIHPADTPLLQSAGRNEKNQFVKAGSPNLLVETAQHYVVRVKPDGSTEGGVIAMSSTQLKKSRQWNSVMATVQLTRGDGTKFTPPTFSKRYRLTTTPESNNHGSWFGWRVEALDFVQDAGQYQQAKMMHEMAASGQLVARPVRPEDDAGSGASTASAGPANKPY